MDRHFVAQVPQLEREIEPTIDPGQVLFLRRLFPQSAPMAAEMPLSSWSSGAMSLQDNSQPENGRRLDPEKAQHAQSAFIQALHLVAKHLPVDGDAKVLDGSEDVQDVHLAVHDKSP